ncbi:branched-chain amino acid aminotransferase II [Leucogyrophana mollusca]|uniref:Branched-chain amino acid aminotransferase II n=1 Tax=Leucogyrophana mollusca TaxID=85980 RepID=A0ACB8BJY8_9AGAM|nr:branched-chain amino acid aminotransferase II [Leucogyrophana mollusca]
MAIETSASVSDENSSHLQKASVQDAGPAPLDASKLKITLTQSPKALVPPEQLRFGHTFSDHMIFAAYDPVTGWSAPEIKPYAPLTLDPSSSCFQYCTNVFEGLKAYVGPDGTPRLFRPELNMRRLERSVARFALPPFDGDEVLKLIKRFVQIDARWIPAVPGHGLYLRPTVIGTRTAINLTASESAILFVIASPTGPYFPQGLRPISLLAVSDCVRAWPGGTGSDKVGGNYAPIILPQQLAAKQGYDQMLWLFGEDNRVTEAGIMNFFVVVTREDGDGLDVITAPLDGTILPGVTRASCLSLASSPAFQKEQSLRLHTHERVFTMADLVQWSAQGRLVEALSVGTAAIIASVSKIGWKGKDITLPAYEAGLGPVGMALREKVVAIQEGREEWEGWGVACD